jgi:cysteine synthase
MTTKKTTKKPTTYVVVIAEYDEGGSDGLAIDNALIFGSADEVAEFIAEDYNDTLLNAFGNEDEDEAHDELTAKEVLKAVKRLKVDDCTEWDTPSDAQCWVKWKVFARA